MTTMIRLTIKEAIRRKFFIGVLLVSLLFIGIMYLPHSFERRGGRRFRRNPTPRIVLPVETQVQLMTHAGFIVINFFGPMLAIVLSAGALSGEIEKGTLIPILSKPLTRWQIFLGRWCGIVAVLALTIGLWTALLWVAVTLRNHQMNWFVWHGAAVALGYPIMFTTIALLFSTFSTTAFAMVLSLFMWGIGWQANIIRALGDPQVFDVELLRTGGTIAGYLVPSQRLGVWVDKLSHWNPILAMRPTFLQPPPPTTFDFLYLSLYVLALLALGLWIFQRRDAM